MLDKVRIKVYGKINLSLNITGINKNLHILDSVLTSISVYDTITVRDRLDDKINLIFNADFVPENNIVFKAVEALRKSFGMFGADIVVDKRIPLAGGMGGSSADGAGVIAALDTLFDFGKRGLDLNKVCSSVGSDVRYMLVGGFARVTGTGDRVEWFDCARQLGVVFSYCGTVETTDVYRVFDELGGEAPVDNDRLIEALKAGEKTELGNMLFNAAKKLCPKIEKVKRCYAELGLEPNMTGSGSVVYALCDDPEREAARLRERGVPAEVAFSRQKGIIVQ